MILFIPQSAQVGEASKAVAEEDNSTGLCAGKELAVAAYLGGREGNNVAVSS